MASKKVTFTNKAGYNLSAKLDLPINQKPKAYAVFAHVFTGSKSLGASRHISRALTLCGIGVLRFDFTGLGDSEGDFADTTFTSNVEDLLAACDYLTENYKAPQLIVGHSLGGAASIFAASKVDSIKAVATVGTPSEPEHVTHLLQDSRETIEKDGVAKVSIGGRQFTIKREFLEDLEQKNMFKVLQDMRKAILVMHSPQDRIVEIDNAAEIYQAAYHPKSFVTLDNADHMLTNKDDAYYVGTVISKWAQRYIDWPEEVSLKTHKQVVARLGDTGYATDIMAGRHGMIADESEDVGGYDFGPSPYQYLSSALGACTAMTMQMYARRKGWPLEEVNVHLAFDRRYRDDCEDCSRDERRIENFSREIEIQGPLSQDQIGRLLEIADRCPVHKTLEKGATITTKHHIK
jgi:putative redox protein